MSEAATVPDDPRANPVGTDEFFIGWLNLPRGYQRFLRLAVPLILVSCALVALVLSASQQSPGPAIWNTADTVIEGVVYTAPYAMIRVPDATSPSAVRTILLVEEGKHGAAERAAPLAGQPVRLTGKFLHRDDRWMLELAANDAGIQPLGTIPSVVKKRLGWAEMKAMGCVTLQGEIVDPKCYLGAMKPGGGKTHKACAALCIAGGIPPMFVTRDGTGRETYYLLTTASGGPINELIRPYVGDAVALTGEWATGGDLSVLRIDVADLRRL
jgi:hypothetical protein